MSDPVNGRVARSPVFYGISHISAPVYQKEASREIKFPID
jgi:hypothetical protein